MNVSRGGGATDGVDQPCHQRFARSTGAPRGEDQHRPPRTLHRQRRQGQHAAEFDDPKQRKVDPARPGMRKKIGDLLVFTPGERTAEDQPDGSFGFFRFNGANNGGRIIDRWAAVDQME